MGLVIKATIPRVFPPFSLEIFSYQPTNSLLAGGKGKKGGGKGAFGGQNDLFFRVLEVDGFGAPWEKRGHVRGSKNIQRLLFLEFFEYSSQSRLDGKKINQLLS